MPTDLPPVSVINQGESALPGMMFRNDYSGKTFSGVTYSANSGSANTGRGNAVCQEDDTYRRYDETCEKIAHHSLHRCIFCIHIHTLC